MKEKHVRREATKGVQEKMYWEKVRKRERERLRKDYQFGKRGGERESRAAVVYEYLRGVNNKKKRFGKRKSKGSCRVERQLEVSAAAQRHATKTAAYFILARNNSRLLFLRDEC